MSSTTRTPPVLIARRLRAVWRAVRGALSTGEAHSLERPGTLVAVRVMRPLPVRPSRTMRDTSPGTEVADTARSNMYFVPLAGGVAALLLGWLAEAIVRSHNTTPISLLLYLVAICLFAATALPTGLRIAGRLERKQWTGTGAVTSAAEQTYPPRRPLIVMIVAVGGAIAAGAASLLLLLGDLSSVTAVWLWLLSMVVLLAGGIYVSRWQRGPALWGINVWPRGRIPARAAIAVVVLIIVVASAARLLALDLVPFGINADEGDRAATAIQIARGQNTQSLFDNGWYWISILYFWLLAQVMKIVGIGFVGARVFGALAGIISVGIVTWLGIRNFGLRVGLIAGGLLSVMAVALQFSRETSEAGPTATLWAASIACFLEAARRGPYWAWIAAGLTGGLSIYFYPTGRLWAVLAVLVCGYLLLHGLGGRRREILIGSVLSGLASVLAVGPFVLRALALGRIEMLTQRAQETSIFTGDNITRLNYVEPGWNVVQLLMAQVVHTVGIFNQFPGQTDFWPVEQPILPVALSLLTLLGLGWCCLRVRDPRFAILAIWFWVGLVGAIITVETPNLQRMATAIPVLALFPALVLDSMAQGIERLADGRKRLLGTSKRPIGQVAGGAAVAIVVMVTLLLAAGQYSTYFQDYGSTDRWPQPSYLGWAVRDAGKDGWVFTLGQQYHMINAGWVRLLAPDAPRGAIISPGSELPLKLPADRGMSFVVFPKQAAYLPYLRDLYPEGSLEQHTHPTEGLMFSTYRIEQEAWAGLQGVLVQPPSGAAERVSNLGVRPPGWTSFPSQMRWTAELSVPQYWNYAFRVRPGPARLEIDGKEVVKVDADQDEVQAVVSLARGNHSVVFDGTLKSAAQAALVRWAPVPEGGDADPEKLQWQEIPTQQLAPAQDGPHGLYASVRSDGYPEQHRIDGALASCRPAGQELYGGESTAITWTGTLGAPSSGVYSMTLSVQGPATLKIDDKPVITAGDPPGVPVGATVDLSKGKHPVEIDYSFGPIPGCIEWVWTPPGGETSIVPPSVLAPPAQAGIGKPLPPEVIGREGQQPRYHPMDVVP
ncbi:MAG: glycosyltransferase family 39 protein [Chloroflexota bacterium]